MMAEDPTSRKVTLDFPPAKHAGVPTYLGVCDVCGRCDWFVDRPLMVYRLAPKCCRKPMRQASPAETAEADAFVTQWSLDHVCVSSPPGPPPPSPLPPVPLLQRIGWYDSCRMPSRIHATIDNGVTTLCGHRPRETAAETIERNGQVVHRWLISAEIPRKVLGVRRYCRVCFENGSKDAPWVER